MERLDMARLAALVSQAFKFMKGEEGYDYWHDKYHGESVQADRKSFDGLCGKKNVSCCHRGHRQSEDRKIGVGGIRILGLVT